MRNIMPINILYIIDSLTHGGTEKQLVQLINALDRSSVQPHLCTLKASEGLYDELDIPKICLNFESFFSPSLIAVQRSLVGFIKQHNIQIVQTFFQDPFLLAALVKPVTGVKLIGSFRDLGFWRTRAESIKMRLAYRLFDGFIANSQAVKDVVVTNDKLKPATIDVIYNGIELTILPDFLPVDQRRPNLVGIVANLNRPVKRVEDFVRAAAVVVEKIPDVQFKIIGGGHLQPELEQLASSLGLAHRIDFSGRIDNPLDYVREFSVGVITSETEGFCNAIVEYMALGIPVVATDTGGNPELVTPGQHGFLYPVGNIDLLAGHICHLLEQPHIRAAMADSNRETIAEHFTLAAMTKQHQDYYQQLATPHSPLPITHSPTWSILTTPEEFVALREEWQQLEEHCSDPDFYLTWDWFYAVTHLAQHPPQQLRLFVARQEGEVVAIVPCMLVAKKLRLSRIRSLELLGNIYSPRRGIVVKKGLEGQIAQSFWNVLNEDVKSQWDLLDFIEVSPQDPFVAALHRACGSARPLSPVHPRVVTSLQEFPTSAEFYRRLGSKMRGNVRRRINKLEKIGTMKLWLFCSDQQDATAAATAYHKIYQASWKEPEADPTFHARLMEDPTIQQKIRVFFLYFDKSTTTSRSFTADDFYQADDHRFDTSNNPPAGAEPIAALYCLVHQGRAYSLKFAYDEQYQDLAPGSSLICFAIKHLIDVEHYQVFDHQKGDEVYKFDWNGHLVEHTQRLRIINDRSRVPRAEIALTTWAKSARNSLFKLNLKNQLPLSRRVGRPATRVSVAMEGDSRAVMDDEKCPLTQDSSSGATPSILNSPRTVIITGADHPTGLGSARALAEQGCHMIGFYQSQTPSTLSKYWNQLIHVPDWEQFIPQLLALGKQLPEKAALFITQDAIVRQVSDHRDQLEPYFYFLLPKVDIVNAFLDKGLFHQWALSHHQPVPGSSICHNSGELDVFISEGGYPVIIKPYEKSERWDSYSPLDKAFVLLSHDDLARIPFDLFAATDRLVAQQYISGNDSDVWFCLVYYNQQSQCVASFTGRKLFQWPVLCGNTAACIADQNVQVESLTRKFFDLAEYQGLGSMEYKYNSADGKYYMIEPTVGRNDFQSNIAMVGGVNLIAIAYADMLGLSLPPQRLKSASWISELGLLDAVRVYKRQGNLNYGDLAKLLRPRMGFAHWHRRDTFPARAIIKKRLNHSKHKKTHDTIRVDSDSALSIRQFDLKQESSESIWGLYRAVYGNDANVRTRWQWEFLQHPQREQVKIYLAERDDRLVGMTVRMPTVLIADGHHHNAEYATNTMVHPEYRGCGVVRCLYRHAAQSGHLQLSKGTMPDMVRQLERMGYKTVHQSFTRVALINPIDWLGLKLVGKKINKSISVAFNQDQYRLIPDLSGLDNFHLGQHHLVTERNHPWMEWRYFQIPHRRYHCYARLDHGQLVGWFVLRVQGHNAILVDCDWNNSHETAAGLIATVFKVAAEQGAVKLTYWGTLQTIHRALLFRGGIRRPFGPVVRFKSDDPLWHQINWGQAHLVAADGDYDYL